MGTQSRTSKPRVCLLCKGTFNTDAYGIKAHFRECVRIARLGLTRPESNLILPNSEAEMPIDPVSRIITLG